MSNFKYVPSPSFLLNTFQELLALRVTLNKAARALDEEGRQGSLGFGVSDDDELEKQRREWDSRYDKIHAQRDVINNLLHPYEDEARQQKEAYESRRCAAMMRY